MEAHAEHDHVSAPAGHSHAVADGHNHPGARDYVVVAVILAVVTSLEVAVYYIESIRPALVPILLVLSTFKFSMVVLWFMHLRFDNRLFSILFIVGLGLGVFVVMVLIILFSTATHLA